MSEPTSINELFSRDPLSLTNTDIDQIIDEFRKRRALFKKGFTTAGNTKKASALTDAQKAASALNIDISL